MTTFTIYRDRKKQHRSNIRSKGRIKWDTGEGNTRRGTIVNSILKLVEDITAGKWCVKENGKLIVVLAGGPGRRTPTIPVRPPSDEQHNFTVTSRPLHG